ncbi:unnamed protein product [Musa hybrid cultivar]
MFGHLKGRKERAMAAGIAGARKALANRSLRAFPSSSPSVRAFARLPRGRLPFGISRSPVELGCAQSLMPFHSVTATALLTSMLSTRPGGWACFSEGNPFMLSLLFCCSRLALQVLRRLYDIRDKLETNTLMRTGRGYLFFPGTMHLNRRHYCFGC